MNNGSEPNRGTKWFWRWKKFPWMWILVGIAIAGLAVIIITEFTGLIYRCAVSEPKGWWQRLFFESDFDSRNKYLLSAAAQVLGAVFALVFSITLVAGQSVAKYTHRTLTVIFNKWILGYMGAFGGAIIWILFCISYPTDARAVMTVTVGIIFVCLSVPLFFLYLVQRMNLEGMSLELKRIGLNATKKNVEVKAREMIAAIDNIGTVAFKEGNYEAAEAAEKALADSLLEIEGISQNLKRKIPAFHKRVFEGLRATCEELIDNPRAPRIVIENLGRVGAQAIEEWLKSSNIPANTSFKKIEKNIPQTTKSAINIIMIVEKACKKENQARLLFACAVALGEMLKASSLKSLRDWVAKKVNHVCKRFKEEQWERSWADKVKRLKSDLGITS